MKGRYGRVLAAAVAALLALFVVGCKHPAAPQKPNLAPRSTIIEGPVQLGSAAAVAGVLGYVNGGTGLSTLGTSGQVLTVSAGAPAWVTPSGGGYVPPTGTGFDHITSGSQDTAARAVNVSTADITGTEGVANGGTGQATLTAHAPLVGEGTSAVVSVGPGTSGVPFLGGGASADPAFGALNLAGGSGVLTGLLPVANVAPGTAAQLFVTNSGATAAAWVSESGDCSITASGVTTCTKINGVSHQAGGALTTGNAAYVSGASATTYSALNLAGGSGWVSGQLPVANLANGTAAQVLLTNSGASAPAWVTESGDCTTTAAGVITCAGLDGHALPSLASGCLNWTGSAWSFASCSGGGSTSVTGTGLWYSAGGSLNAAAIGFSGDATFGALSGGNVPITVAKVNSTSYPAGGALTTGNGPYVSGASAVTYSALNLAGGSGWVTGALPVANGGTGQTTIFGSITTVASGALTTLSQASIQRVLIETDGSAATVKFPASPNAGDVIWVHTYGTTVTNAATVNANGNHVEDPNAPGSTTGSGSCTLGINPGASGMWIYETTGTLWRLWL